MGSLSDHNVQFLAFFLKSFVEKVFYNLIRDITFSEGFTEEEQIRFCKTLGHIFYDLSTHLQEQKYDGFYNTFAKQAMR